MDYRLTHLGGCVGFWLWAVVGAIVAFGFVSFLGWLILLPAVGIAYLVQRRAQWKDGPVLLGIVTGAGVPLLVVAALNWSAWYHRDPGNGVPNPYGWGGVGLCLVVAGTLAYAFRRPRA